MLFFSIQPLAQGKLAVEFSIVSHYRFLSPAAAFFSGGSRYPARADPEYFRNGSGPDGSRCIAPPGASIPESADSLAHPRGRCNSEYSFVLGTLISNTYAGTMALTPAGLSTSSRRYDFCEGLPSSTRRRVATLRRSGSNTCPASSQPIRRPHAIIFRPFRSSPNSSTMHFMQFTSYRPSAGTSRAGRAVAPRPPTFRKTNAPAGPFVADAFGLVTMHDGILKQRA